MSRLNRVICAVLLIVALMGMPLEALAMNRSKDNKITKDDTPTAAFVYTYILTVYDKPTKESEVLEEVPFAKKITKLKESQGWAKVVTTNDVIGFCNAKQLTETDPNNLDVIMYCQQYETKYYLRPSSDAPVMGYLHRNERVRVTAMTPMNDWVRFDGEELSFYIPRPCLDYEKFNEKGVLAWVNKEKMDVYYDVELDSKIGTIYFGQEVTLLDDGKDKHTRAKIRSRSGLIGYCDLDCLITENPNSLDITCYTQVDGQYLFVSPTDDSGHRSIQAGEEMLLDAVDEQRFWARVKYQNEYYYVPFLFLDGGRRKQGSYKIIHTIDAANIKGGTKQSSSVVATVPAGTELLLIGATDYHARVATLPDENGIRQTGYVEIEYLR